MGYISDLRKKIGHDRIIMVGATAYVENEKGEILMQLRSDTNDWSLPGGSMEIGETLEEAVKRELFEETGLEASGAELMTTFSGREYFYTYPNGDKVDTLIILYRMTGITGVPKISDDESYMLKYFPKDALPKPLEARTEIMFGHMREMGIL